MQKQSQIAQKAIQNRAVSELLVPNKHPCNLTSLKVKNSFAKALEVSFKQRVGPTQQSQLSKSDDFRSVVLDRNASVKQLNQDFPGNVVTKVLFRLTSEFYKKKL